MNNHIFKITDSNYIRIHPVNVSIEQISFMNKVQIFWCSNHAELLIGLAWSSDIIDNLTKVLSRSLKNELIFNYNNCTSPAIFHNEFWTPEEARPLIEENAYKKGRPNKTNDLKYYICDTNHTTNPSLVAWIHNDTNNNIILEIGEQFIWPNIPEDELLIPTDPTIQNFFKFIENYKPMIKTIIPHDIATTWLKQTTELQNLMNMNEKLDCPECMNNSHSSGQVHMRETK